MEYIFVHRIDNAAPVDQHIPFHMTALHWFAVDANVDDIVAAASRALSPFSVMDTRVTQEDKFGPQHDIPVARLQRTADMEKLHAALGQAMLSLGAKLDVRWVGADKWNPHVTHTDSERLSIGDTVRIDSLDLIARESHDGPRQLVKTFFLK